MWAQPEKNLWRAFLIPLLSVGSLEVVTGPTSQLDISFCLILLPSLPLPQALNLKTLLNKQPACLNSVSWSPSQRTTLQHFLTLLFSFVISHRVAWLQEMPGNERMHPYPGWLVTSWERALSGCLGPSTPIWYVPIYENKHGSYQGLGICVKEVNLIC